jgi:hypothetical protein
MRLKEGSEWHLLKELFKNRLVDAQRHLEEADEKHFRIEQGRLHELRFLLNLETSAKAHLDNTRNPKRTTAIE